MIKSRSYLKDYKMTADGQYIYTGGHYRIGADSEGRRKALGLFAAAAAVLVTASGCVDWKGMHGVFYVLIPYMLEACSAFVFVFQSVKLLLAGKQPKEHVYLSAVKRYLPASAVALAISSALSVVTSVIFILLKGKDYLNFPSFLYIMLKAVTFATAVFASFDLKKMHWDKAEAEKE